MRICRMGSLILYGYTTYLNHCLLVSCFLFGLDMWWWSLQGFPILQGAWNFKPVVLNFMKPWPSSLESSMVPDGGHVWWHRLRVFPMNIFVFVGSIVHSSPLNQIESHSIPLNHHMYPMKSPLKHQEKSTSHFSSHGSGRWCWRSWTWD